jgi:uncharacterized protein (TIGR03437 family)
MTARYTLGILAVAGLLTGASWLHAQSAPLQIITDPSLPPAALGAAYFQQLVTTGGLCSSNGTPSSTIDAGALPPGLSITSPASTKQWILEGTPVAAGNFSFTAHLTWTYNRVNPADTNCVDNAIQAFTLTVQGGSNPNPTLAVDRSQIATTYHIGTSPPAADIVHVTSTAGASVITVQAATDSGGPWLSVTPTGATTPATLSINYSVSGLAQGTYTGRVIITSGTLPALTIPVTLQAIVDNQTLAANPQQISTTYHIGTFPPNPDTVQVTSSAGAAAITLQAATDSGGPWLSVSPLSATTPAALAISYSVSGLTQGTYTGRVTVGITGTLYNLMIPVTLQVIADNIQLQVTPSSLVFSTVAGGRDPPAQSINVTVAGLNRLFQTVVSAPPNGKWLTVAPSAALTPATLSVAVTTKDLPAATYNGSLTMAVSGLPGSVTIPVTFTIQTPAPRPAITAGGVVDAAGFGQAIAPGTWVSVFGTALSATTRAWRDADFVNGLLPTSLDGVSVTIDGKPAAVAYISPTQINVLATDDTATGLVPVVVKNTAGTSDAVLTLQQTGAPALFEFPGGKYAAAFHVDGSFIASPVLVQQQGLTGGTAAHVGETIVLFGTGFGATQPPISATALVKAPLPLADPAEFSLRIGGADATIAYAGLISPGVYQFNVVVPLVAAGDQPVVAELRGLLSQSPLLITIQ